MNGSIPVRSDIWVSTVELPTVPTVSNAPAVAKIGNGRVTVPVGADDRSTPRIIGVVPTVRRERHSTRLAPTPRASLRRGIRSRHLFLAVLTVRWSRRLTGSMTWPRRPTRCVRPLLLSS